MTRRTSLLHMLSILALCAGATSCGNARSSTQAKTAAVVASHKARAATDGATAGAPDGAPARAYVKDDGDDEPPSEDHDDRRVRGYGRPSGAAARRAIADLLRRYFALARSDDGRRGCSLLSTKLARSHDLSTLVPQEYASPYTAALRGDPCTRFMSALFRLDRPQIEDAHTSTLRVTSVRVSGRVALATVAFKGFPERQLSLVEEHGVWKVDSLLDQPIP